VKEDSWGNGEKRNALGSWRWENLKGRNGYLDIDISKGDRKFRVSPSTP
jgi:hypothetical protein